jgi:hypothetical protein
MKHYKNLRYLLLHRWYVFLCGLKRGVPIWQLIVHDFSKFSRDEWSGYANYFFGDKKDKDAFNKAWNHHQKYNKHHWQYWVMINDGGALTALEMPERYRREMLADWEGAGMANNGAGINQWYLDHKDTYIFHDTTRRLIEKDLGV